MSFLASKCPIPIPNSIPNTNPSPLFAFFQCDLLRRALLLWWRCELAIFMIDAIVIGSVSRF